MTPHCPHKIQSLLATKTVTVVPYGRGEGYPADTLYHAWKAMHDAQALARVFYEQPVHDLEAFCEYMTHAVLFLAVTRESPSVVGAVWFTGVTPERGNIGIWYRKELWGEYSRTLTRRVCTYAFHTFGWRHMFGFTPWRAAAQHGLTLGWQAIATLPQFVRVGTRLLPLHVIRLENTVCRREKGEALCLRRSGSLAERT